MKPRKPIGSLILTVRGQRVILDADLAELYGVPTKALNQAVKRNAERFPEDFRFQLTAAEWADVRSQIVTGPRDSSATATAASNRPQSVTGSHKHRDPRFRPYAFTEHGAMMAAMVLSSPEATAMSVYVVRAFIQMREQLATSAEILRKLEQIDHRLLDHDQALVIVWDKIKQLMSNPLPLPPKPKRRIGFHP